MRGDFPVKPVALPDYIDYDTVVQALRVLGLDSGHSVEVTLSTKRVTVEMGIAGGGGSISRTYLVGSWPVRYQPKEER